MGGDDHDKDGKYSFNEFKIVVESHQGSDFGLIFFLSTLRFYLTRDTDRKIIGSKSWSVLDNL